LGAGLAACIADRGPAGKADAGKPRDAGVDATSCMPAPGGNEVSFDLVCTPAGGACSVNTHLSFQVPSSSKIFPGCGVGGGNLELANLTPHASSLALTGTDGAALEVDVNPYSGPDKYPLVSGSGAPALFFSLGVTAPCEEGGGSQPVSLIVEDTEGAPDAAVDVDGGIVPPSSCDFVVSTDCTNGDRTHDVTGTLSCSFPQGAGNDTCTIQNGTFHFSKCVP
jgi:hypothetical protein